MNNNHIITLRELQVLKMIASQKTMSEIADELYISSNTVATHRMNILRKLNAKNTAGLIVRAYEESILQVSGSRISKIQYMG